LNKETLFKLWAYDADAKMWAEMKGDAPEKSIDMIERIQKKSEKIRDELFEFILTVDDPYYRVLLSYRCIERRGWKWIAKMLGGSAESHRKALARFIEKIE